MTTIGQKAEYVIGQPQTRNHLCHWPGCETQVPPAKFMCKKHWFRLPRSIRVRIWATYQIGQEKSGRATESYVSVAKEAIAWAKDNDDPQKRLPLD